MRPDSLWAGHRRRRVEEVLEMVELPGLYDRPTSELSGGMRKRVGLARAIVHEPEVVVLCSRSRKKTHVNRAAGQ